MLASTTLVLQLFASPRLRLNGEGAAIDFNAQATLTATCNMEKPKAVLAANTLFNGSRAQTMMARGDAKVTGAELGFDPTSSGLPIRSLPVSLGYR